MDVIGQLEQILPGVVRLAEGVRPHQYGDRTPCVAFSVRDVFGHMIEGASSFAPQLRGHTNPEPPEVSGLSDEERLSALRTAMEDLLASVKAPGALGRTVELPFGSVPGEVLARFITVDGMVHSWDIATATGQRYEPDDELASAVLATANDLISPEMRDGDAFAAEVLVPADEAPVVRLAAFTGRSILLSTHTDD